MSNKKFKIDEAEGIKLFLEKDLIPETKEQAPEPLKKTSLFKKLGIVAIICCLVLSLFFFKEFLNDYRAENYEYKKIEKSYLVFLKEVGYGNSSHWSRKKKIEKADSLKNSLKESLLKYPNNKKLNRAWCEIIVQLKLLDEIEDYYEQNELEVLLDEDALKRIKKYYPELLGILGVLKDIKDFYDYKQEYPKAPANSTLIPKFELVENLLKSGEDLQKKLSKNLALLETHFKELRNYTNIVLNNYYPEIVKWNDFYQKYKIIREEKNEDKKQQLILELSSLFPKVGILKEKMQIQKFRKIVNLGMLEHNYQKFSKELPLFLKFLDNNSGYDFEISIFKNYSQLEEALLKDSISLAYTGEASSYRFLLNEDLQPLVSRAFSDQEYVSNYLVSLEEGDRLLNLKDRTLLIGGFEKVLDYFQLLTFMDKQGLNQKKFFKEIILLEAAKDEIFFKAKQIPRAVFLLNEEDLVTYEKELTGAQLITEVAQQPLGLIFYNKNFIPQEVVKELRDYFLSLSSKLVYGNNKIYHFLTDWNSYDSQKYENYYQSCNPLMISKINRIEIIIDNQSKLKTSQIATRLIRELASKGYNGYLRAQNFQENQILAEKDLALHLKITQEGSSYLYDFRIEQETILFWEVLQAKSEKIADFSLLINNAIAYLPFESAVLAIENQIVKALYQPGLDLENKKVRFFSDNLGKTQKISLGKGKIINQNNDEIFIKVSKELAPKIKKGDLVEFNNED